MEWTYVWTLHAVLKQGTTELLACNQRRYILVKCCYHEVMSDLSDTEWKSNMWLLNEDESQHWNLSSILKAHHHTLKLLILWFHCLAMDMESQGNIYPSVVITVFVSCVCKWILKLKMCSMVVLLQIWNFYVCYSSYVSATVTQHYRQSRLFKAWSSISHSFVWEFHSFFKTLTRSANIKSFMPISITHKGTLLRESEVKLSPLIIFCYKIQYGPAHLTSQKKSPVISSWPQKLATVNI